MRRAASAGTWAAPYDDPYGNTHVVVLDDATQSALYERLRERLPHTAIISIGHRTSLKRFHERALEIDKSAGGAGVLKWAN